VSVVTKIAREHTDTWVTDLAAIAREKAGIAKRGVPFVTGEPDPPFARSRGEAERRGAPGDSRGPTRAPTGPLA